MSYTHTLTIQSVPEAASFNRKAILSTITVLLVMLVINLVMYFTPVKAQGAPSFNEQVLMNLTNKERVAAGLPELAYDAKLAAAARAKAEDMIKHGYFDHVSPTGKQPWDFIRETGYVYLKAGENLAIDYPTVTGPVPAWMASPTHRANILKPSYEEVGIAEVVGMFNGKETRVVVQMFGTEQFSLRPIMKLLGR